MIFCWFAGDIFKGLYYINKKAPMQLIVCAFFQLIIDILIMAQIYIYSKVQKTISNDEMIIKIKEFESKIAERTEENSRLVSYD